jgi:CHASE3 domain sensor protein
MNPFNASSSPKSVDRRIVGLLLMGCLVLLNVVGLAYFTRLDLTRDKEFTLSDATRTALRTSRTR